VSRFTAFRFCLVPTIEQAAVLRRHAGASRFAFNQCLRLVKDGLDAKPQTGSVKTPWTGFDLVNAFNAWKRSAAAGRLMVAAPDGTTTVVATGLAWRSQVCQQVFEEAAIDLGRALAGFSTSRLGRPRGRRVGFPRFKRKTSTVAAFRIRSKTSPRGRASVRVGDGTPRSVSLPVLGTLRVREDTRRLRRMLGSGRATILSATVSYRAGRWVVSLTVEAADRHDGARHPPRAGAGGWVGVDRGLTAFVVAATSSGVETLRIADMPRPLRNGLPRLRRLTRAVGRKQHGSANRCTAAARLNRHHAHIRNIRHEFLHKVANALVQTHDRLAVEDLNIAGMLANRRLARAIADAAWAEFARILTYKQQWRGGQVALVDRWFPSSRTCPSCRAVRPSLPLSERTFVCHKCGQTRDRDLNAATNLAIWADQHHAQIRDPHAGGPVTNAYRGEGSRPRIRADEPPALT
jgi:putative transposase